MMDGGRQVPGRRLTKCHSSLFNRNMKFVFLLVSFAKVRRTAFNVRLKAALDGVFFQCVFTGVFSNCQLHRDNQ